MKKRQKNLQPWIIIGAVALVLMSTMIIVFMPKGQQVKSPSMETTQEMIEYNASGLDIKIMIPEGAVIDDRPNLLVLYYGNDQISGFRIATDFESIDEYLADLSTKNNWDKFDQESLTIAGDPSWIEITEYRERPETIYFIKKGDWVYSFNASTPELEEDLEMILKTIVFKD